MSGHPISDNSGSHSSLKYPLVIFDMDGVLTDHVSSWMFMHQHFNVDNEQGYRDYKDGKIDDLEFMSQDIRLWRTNKPGITFTDVQDILNAIPLMKGVKEVFETLKKNGIRTAIISGGLAPLSKRIAGEFGIDWVRSNSVETNSSEELTGEGLLNVSLRTKDRNVREIAALAGVPLERIVAIGDTRVDASMFSICGLGIAFDPKDEIAREAADVIITKKDLREILPHIL